MIRYSRRFVLASLACSAFVAHAQGASFPTKPIRLVVTFPPGGSADFVARLVAGKLQESLGQPVIVDNKPGATGNIGVQDILRAPPDGHTLVFLTSAVTITPHLQKVPFDITRDLVPVAQLNSTPYVLTVNATTPYRTMTEFLAAAKARPGSVNYGSYGVGSPTHLSMLWLASEAAVNMNHVPYKGSSPMLIDLVGGRIEAAFDLPSNVLPHVKTGKLRVIAVGSPKPAYNFPDAPTVASAYPGYNSDGWQGIMAPAGTPPAITELLAREIQKALRAPDVRSQLVELGFNPMGNTPAEFATSLRDDLKKWGELIKANNISSTD
jgi:tripartite-type tricarboxylate transporter receptor subunit TctC